jgi:Histidine kinase-, DNA gyrase B-, and HSP90-like ATPase.
MYHYQGDKMSSDYIIGNVLLVVMRSCHLAVYYKLRKNNLLGVILGIIIICFTTAQPFFKYSIGTSYGAFLGSFIVILFISLMFSKLVFEGNYRQLIFGVLSVGIFGNLCQIVAISLCRMVLADPGLSYGFLVNRLVELICLLLFLPVLYFAARKPFRLILNEIGKSKWYITLLVPSVLYILSMTVSQLTMSSPGNHTVILGVFFIANTLSFYWILYFMTTQKRFNHFLSRVVESSQNMIPYYRFYMEELGKKETRIRTLRHDLRHVMGSLALAARNGDTGKIVDMAKNLATTFENDTEIVVFSANPTINAVISFYFSIATEKDVKCEAKLSIPETLPFSDAEIAMLIGNALENSVKAAIPLGTEGWITIKGTLVNESLVIKVINNFSPGHVRQGEGIGLESMRMLCEKHSGNLTTEVSENEFKLVAILCLESETGKGEDRQLAMPSDEL